MSTSLTSLRETANAALADLRTKDLDALATIAQDAAEIVHLRIGECLSMDEIAVRIGVPVATIEARLVRARAAGILSTTDEIKGMMQHRIVPKAIDVLSHHLNERSEESAIAALKGAGVLVSHQRSQQQTETNTTLRVIVENRDGTPVKPIDPATMTGQIVGTSNPDTEAPSAIRQGI